MGEEGVEEARISSRRREDEEEVVQQQQQQLGRKERKISWAKLRRVDSLNLEAQAELPHHHHHQYGSSSSSSRAQWTRTLSFAFQCIGVVYGDIGTSPLYVYKSTFTNGIKRKEDILGVLSLIIYTMLLIPMIKYVSIVLWANDNGDGGTFALYSLLCRHLKVSLIPNGQPEDAQLSNYNLLLPSASTATRLHVKQKLETSRPLQMLLFLVTILGTSMVIGDGVLTPAISVMSAVDGIASSLGQDAVVGISVAILVVTFAVQRFGTDKVGFSFAPIILIWFMFIAGIGAYNLFKYDVGVLRAFNPKYIIDYFSNNGKEAWISLGGVVLCITGTEAMFADLGHFNVPAVQISFSGLVFPAITTAYIGQAAYLTKFPEHVDDTFYKSIPDPLYWPTFVVAIAAAIIASQAMISGAFAIISQSLSLGCFPRVKVVHTSAKYEGQVYIPEINYLLMIACVIVVIAFKSTEQIGHAYGIAVVAVMVMTTCMVSLIMLVIWRTRLVWIVVFFVVFGLMEVVYLSAVLYKFKQGGYLPLAFSLFLMMIMGIWHYVHKQRYMYELKNKVSPEYIAQLLQQGDGTSTKGTTAKGTNANTTTISRVPGMAFLYSELVQGIPPIFPHFLANIPSIHSVLVFVSLKSLPISKVLPQERFLFRQVEPKEYRMFRCVVRYGYNDVIEEPHEFERQLVHNLKDFIRHDHFIREGALLAPPPPTASLINNDDSGGHVDINSDSQHNASVTTATAHSGRRSFNSIVHVEEALQQPMHGSHRVSSRRSSSSIQSTSARPNNNNENSNHIINDGTSSNIGITSVRSAGGNKLSLSPLLATVEEETQFVQKAMDNGVVYLLGEAEVVAEPNSSLLKKFVVNYAYSFLRKNFREGEKVLAIPQTRLLRVGMTYEI